MLSFPPKKKACHRINQKLHYFTLICRGSNYFLIISYNLESNPCFHFTIIWRHNYFNLFFFVWLRAFMLTFDCSCTNYQNLNLTIQSECSVFFSFPLSHNNFSQQLQILIYIIRPFRWVYGYNVFNMKYGEFIQIMWNQKKKNSKNKNKINPKVLKNWFRIDLNLVAINNPKVSFVNNSIFLWHSGKSM